MVGHRAQSIHATATWARIAATVVLANLVPWTFIISYTLGLGFWGRQRSLLGEALLIGVALVVALASTSGSMVLYATRGAKAAEARAGIVAIPPNASLAGRTLIIGGTASNRLTASVGDGVSLVAFIAGAERLSVVVGKTIGVVAAGVGRAGISDDNRGTSPVGIAFEAILTTATSLPAKNDGAVGVATTRVLGARVGLWLHAPQGGGVLRDEAGEALADRPPVDFAALHVGAASVGSANLLGIASSEWVSGGLGRTLAQGVSLNTCALGSSSARIVAARIWEASSVGFASFESIKLRDTSCFMSFHLATFTLLTRVLSATRIDALAIDASLLPGTLFVAVASDFCRRQASIVSIWDESWRTELADGLVVLHNAGGATIASKSIAGIHALVVLTGLAVGTSLVLETDGYLGLAALGADADGFVLQNLTGLSSFAGLVATGILALAVETGLVGRAVRVEVADVVAVVGAGADELAGRVDDHLFRADALGSVFRRLALLVGLASGRSGQGAGVSADAAVAHLVEVALLVAAALSADDAWRHVAAVLELAGDGGAARVALWAVAPDFVADD